VRRLPMLVASMALLVLVPAAPASAHTVSGAGATNFRSRVVSVTPVVPGLRVRVVENGRRVQTTNSSRADVVVLGYFGEPYLRVGPAGVFANAASPSVALNAPGVAGGPVTTAPAAVLAPPPDWRRVSSGHTVLWHDHRTHWAGPVPAVLVAHAPGTGVVLREWRIDLVAGGRLVEVGGTLTYVRGPSPWPWLALAVGLGLATVAVARSRWWARGLAWAVAALVVSDAAHALGTGLVYAASTGHRLALIVAGSYYSIVAWAVGAVAVRLLQRRSVDGLFAATFCGLVIGVWGGLADLTVLSRSQPPFAWPAALERVIVSAALGLGLGIVVGAVLAYRRNGDSRMALWT
jgi:hypothetical protein